MSAVKQAYELTEQLMKLTNQPITNEDRDQHIEQITELLSKRDELLSDIKPPFSEEENQLGKQMAIWNEQILSKFFELKKQIQMDLTQLKKTKATSNQYLDPYNLTNTDGMFYDKRK